MLPAQRIAGGYLVIADLPDAGRMRAQVRRIGAIETQRRRNHDPVLVTLEHALTIAEFTLRVADFADSGTVEKAHLFDALMDRMAVSAGIAVNRAANPTRNARHRFQTRLIPDRW